MEFVLLAFATFMGWVTLASFLPFRVPAKLQVFAVFGIAVGLSFVPTFWLLVVASVGAVALLHSLVGDAPDPVDMTKLKNLVPRRAETYGRRRVPNDVGSRIPRL